MTAPGYQEKFPSQVAVSVDHIVLPGRKRASAVLRLCSLASHGLVIWSHAALDDFYSALKTVDQAEVEAIVIVGDRASFGAGANLDEIQHSQSHGGSESFIQVGHDVFGALADAQVPTFSVMTGQALGGGLELALHTTWRIGHKDGGPLGLPECRLGFFPGWGGVYFLPHIIGPQAALDVIVFDAMKGRFLSPVEAKELGIVDALVDVSPDAEQWEESWQSLVAHFLATSPHRSDAVHCNFQQWLEAVAAARSKANMLWQGAAPAPLVALNLVEAAYGQSREENAAVAVKLFADVVTGQIARDCLRTFRLVDSRSRRGVDRPDVAGRNIRKVAVIGAGLMARQIAALCARSLQVPVVLTDLDPERLDEGVRWVADRFASQVERGCLKPEQAQRWSSLVSTAVDDADVSDADFVIEATPEDMQIKKAVFAQWTQVIAEDAIVATNTSSLSVEHMAEAVVNPGRFVGFHVFNPVESTPLVEIVTTTSTTDTALATVCDVAAAMRRTAVCVADAPGFVVNRILLRMFSPIFSAIDQGMDPRVADHALDPLGLPMTPLELLDFVGPAVLLHVAERMHGAYPDRFHVSPWMSAVVRAGLTHVLDSDRGGSPTSYLSGAAEKCRVETVQPGGCVFDASELRRIVEGALAQEIGVMLHEGVVARAEDVDLCMVLGANWPLYLGGITPYLDRVGASGRVLGRRFSG